MHVLFAFYRYFYELQAPRNQLDFDFEQMLARARAHTQPARTLRRRRPVFRLFFRL